MQQQADRFRRLAVRWEGLLVVLILGVAFANSRLSPDFLRVIARLGLRD